MAASEAGARQPRRGPAPIASFDHDVSDESSPEGKQPARLAEIRERTGAGAGGLAAPEPRARSHSAPGAGALAAPPAPRIDISRASSSSHHDSRDSSPELALFAGAAGEDRARLELGFREDGALDLRSSTEELAFLEPAPTPPRAPPAPAPAPPPPPPAERRHSRKDSQSSEAALLGVSGRTSRLSSVGSQCSAQSALSALSRVSRLSVVSGASRSPSPHRMLLETSFCGPKPIETDPEIGAGALVEQILGIVKTGAEAAGSRPATPATSPPAPAPEPLPPPPPAPVDARDRREVRTEATVEPARPPPAPPAVTVHAAPQDPAPDPAPAPPAPALVDAGKNDKEERNRTRTEERRARPRIRREPSEPEVYKSGNRTKDIIRIKLRPDDSYEEEGAGAGATEAARKPATLELGLAARPAAPAPPSPAPSRRRSPSPAGAPVSRKSSFCSLFKSRETIASPESPSEALRRKRSLTEGRSRSKSRDRSATPTSASKIRGSVLSLFRTPRRSAAGASPSPGSRDGSPGVPAARPLAAPAPADRRRADKLKYYEDAKDGIIHIPLRTPPDERGAALRRSSGGEAAAAEAAPREPRPASAPQPRAPPDPPDPPPRAPGPSAESKPKSESQPRPQPESQPRARAEPRHTSTSRPPAKPIQRTVLPDGSIIIPLHSPTETETDFPELPKPAESSLALRTKTIARTIEEPRAFEEARALPNHIDDCAAGPTPHRTREGSIAPDHSPARETPGAAERSPATPGTPAPGEPDPHPEDARRRRKERLVFTTHVGSREQVFSTQFSITKTPSVTSEISGSFSSFTEGEPLRDTHIAAPPAPGARSPPAASSPAARSPAPDGDAPRDSSESDPSSEAAPSRAGNDVEKRGLVVQESFEEELPYVPTTLPQERSVALPMVPVRERGGVRVSGVQRPRAAGPPPARAAPPAAPAPPPAADKLRIKLPRRPRAAAAAPRPQRPRARSGDDSSGGESRAKAEWIDFEEVPERRKQPKRIQTLPAGAVDAGGVMFSYVEPEHCRCECHAHARAEDQLPLLRDEMQASVISTSSAECESERSQAELGVLGARALAADLDAHPDRHAHKEPPAARH